MARNKMSLAKVNKIVHLILYYLFARHLPSSYSFAFGGICKRIRYYCVKNIFSYCGNNVNVERKAYFGRGFDIEIGDNSGIGANCEVPSDLIIGKNVLMGPNVCILSINHRFNQTDIPMHDQGYQPSKKTIICDDVWIGRQVIFTPGRFVKKGTIIAAGTVLCKDFDEYSIVGGNPSKLIRCRLNNS